MNNISRNLNILGINKIDDCHETVSLIFQYAVSSKLKCESYKRFNNQSLCMKSDGLLKQAEICKLLDSFFVFTYILQGILRKYISLMLKNREYKVFL